LVVYLWFFGFGVRITSIILYDYLRYILVDFLDIEIDEELILWI